MQRSRLGAHDELIETTKKNVAEESNQLQTELKAKIGEVCGAQRGFLVVGSVAYPYLQC